MTELTTQSTHPLILNRCLPHIPKNGQLSEIQNKKWRTTNHKLQRMRNTNYQNYLRMTVAEEKQFPEAVFKNNQVSQPRKHI